MRSLAVLGAAAVVTTVLTGVVVAAPSADAATGAAAIRAAASTSLFAGGPYRSATSEAAKAADALRTSDPAGAAAAATIARYPVAIWLGDWTRGTTLTTTIDRAVAAAEQAGTTPVFVTYAIPDRDCGGYSAGGLDETAYDAWVDQIAGRLAGHRAAVVVEPDSLAMLSNAKCDATLDAQRYRILSRSVAAFTAAGVPSYLDAGNSNWQPVATMADRLRRAGVAEARGFFTNVANYYPTTQEQAYAEKLSAATGGAHYVIDTSRNGQGWRGTWCNGPGAGLGTSPRVVSDGTALDALLWVKTPGASDGTCNGGPAAGTWFSSFAQTLVAKAQLGAAAAQPARAYRADPYGSLERVATASAGVAVTGWAFDGDEPDTALSVAVTVDGRTAASLTADATRTDVAAQWGVGREHGYAGVVPTTPGKHRVCAVARNVGAGADSTADPCRTVTVPAVAPTGRLDAVTSPSHRRVAVRGWTFDRDDTSRALRVRVTAGGRTVGTLVADARRTDVDRAHGAGPAHGLSGTVTVASGSRSVCLTALGVGSGGDRSLGCRTVRVR
ncbi:glycoside hydrolase family 6 protein [Curtobacterium sp. DN_7.5]|uniref:glycoside hydrolase family 6 protein n=1 Tax=Curtobacterium sp. DN_7.5 TaxID=3049047 RepID=UPI001F5868FE|nr:glycoside hydrolase family 6 protein [Curtobacterium sp. DN_7.5]